jgi:alpha-glucosidase
MSKGENQPVSWSRQAVVYQIYPISFMDSSGNGKGDLKGVIDKLDYLNDGTDKSLGIGAIWLSPIYKSPMVDFGYDVSDYRDVNSLFGDLNTFDILVKEAHRRNIKVIMDFIPNHTSVDHPWFQESRASVDNAKRDWYIWKEAKTDGSVPNNWLSVFGGSAWQLDKTTGQYYLHSFLKEQADLNWRNEEVRKAMLEAMHFWMDRGVDGFRTDAIYHLIKDKNFTDNPLNPNYKEGEDDPYNKFIHINSQGREETLDSVGAMCELLGQHDDTFMVTEAYLSVPEMMKMYKACANNLHAPFNYNLIGMPWSAKKFRKHIDDFENSLTPQDWPNYAFGNHDRSRVASRLGRRRARLIALMAFTFRGMPFVYYGDEIGMVDVPVASQDSQDPFEKNVPGRQLGRDPERTPMQWDRSPNAGFTAGKPWLPVADDFEEYNVETESKNPASILSLYKRLIHFRSGSPALLTGSYRSLDVDNDNIFAYLRECAKEKLLVVVNFSDKDQTISLPQTNVRQVCNAYCDHEFDKKYDNLEQLKLRGYEGYVFSV